MFERTVRISTRSILPEVWTEGHACGIKLVQEAAGITPMAVVLQPVHADSLRSTHGGERKRVTASTSLEGSTPGKYSRLEVQHVQRN